jgi:eukaryotic-like serine/threonine-protein kinase
MAVHVGELIVGRYELEELVGKGGMSSVYRAYDTVLERRVAIKVLHEHFSRDPEYVERFRREARAIARLAHPNIVTVIDRGEWEDRQFIVFEHVAGENLKAVIDREGPLPVDRAVRLACQIGQALSFAHQLGIVHRDVKPHNVLIDANGTAKVTDFGIARAVDADDALTATGTVLGTGQYLSPEQANGGRGDERSDQYSLGVVAYELLAGEPPYSGDSLMAVAMRHVRDPVPSVRDRRPDVPQRVDAVIAKAMAKRPEDRFASMEALTAALESCLAEEARPGEHDEDTGIIPPRRPAAPAAATEAIARPAPPPRTRVAQPRRSGLRVAGALLLAAVVLVGGLLVLELAFEGGVPGLGGDEPTPVRVQAVSDLDPYGDGTEHPDEVGLATDRDVATYWPTES